MKHMRDSLPEIVAHVVGHSPYNALLRCTPTALQGVITEQYPSARWESFSWSSSAQHARLKWTHRRSSVEQQLRDAMVRNNLV